MAFTSKDIITTFDTLILDSYGEHAQFDHTACPKSANASSLIFLQSIEQLPEQVAVIVTCKKVAQELRGKTKAYLIAVEDIRLAQAKIKQCFDDYQATDAEWPRIHKSAVIHSSAKLGENCRIGPNVVIGANCQLADHVIVRANSVVEHGVTIEQGSIINANVNIGYNTHIGRNVTIQAGAIIGSEGYGFATDAEHHHHRIPHTGNVIIGNDVHIGANTCIDRGTYEATVIARGVKIDNLVHIAHNVHVDEDCLLTAQTVIAGSSTLGKRVICSGQTGILDHKTVPDDTVLVQRAGVTENLPHGGMWAGSPAKPFKEWVRSQTVHKKITRLEKNLKDLQAELNKNLNK